MAKILVFNSSMAELAALQEIFSKEPFFEFFSVESESQIKFYRESLGEGASPILLCCGLEGNNSNWSQTRVLFEDIKIAWPKAKVFLVSFDSLLMDQTEHKLPAKVDEKIDLSDDSEKNRSEIIKKIKAGLPAKKKSENEGIIPGLLIVDDEENILKTIPMLLRSVGFDRIWTAGTIEDALVVFDDYQKVIDVCLVDYNLKDTKADKLIIRLKEISPKIKIFMMTGEGKTPWSKEIGQLIDGVLSKPFYDIEEPIKIINDVLKKETIQVEKKKKKILVIDDSPETAQFLEKIFEGEYLVIQAPDGETGIKKYEEVLPDFVVFDYKLPGKNGLEVLKELRAIYPEMKSVAITIEKNPKVTIDFLQAGAFKVFQKPINAKEIKEAIRGYLV